jgi:hypothetical protein
MSEEYLPQPRLDIFKYKMNYYSINNLRRKIHEEFYG